MPDSLEGAAMAVPPPFTLAVPVERAAPHDVEAEVAPAQRLQQHRLREAKSVVGGVDPIVVSVSFAPL